MVIDCETCAVRGPACGDCVVSVLLGIPSPAPIDLGAEDHRAIDVLADAGLVPRLRLVSTRPDRQDPPRRAAELDAAVSPVLGEPMAPARGQWGRWLATRLG